MSTAREERDQSSFDDVLHWSPRGAELPIEKGGLWATEERLSMLAGDEQKDAKRADDAKTPHEDMNQTDIHDCSLGRLV